MTTIKDGLVANGFSQKEIDKFVNYYNYANDNKIPYPYYYAMAKLSI